MRGLLAAMHKELAPPFTDGEPLPAYSGLDLRMLDRQTVLCVCGVGKVNAALAAQLLIDRFAVDELWNAGVSGSLREDPAGTLIAAEFCVQHDLEIFGDPAGQVPVLERTDLLCAGAAETVELLTAAGLPCRAGVVATGDWFGRDFPRAERIRDGFGADVCDMEAGAAAQVCLRAEVPFRCLKVVSDHVFHPSQYEEYQANLPQTVRRLSEALALLLGL